MPAQVIQLMPLSDKAEAELYSKYETCRFFEVADKDGWLAEHGSKIRAVVTSGHLGVTDAMLGKLPALGIVAIAGVGYEHVNRPLARSRGIAVTNTPDVLTDDVADLAIGLMIAAMRGMQGLGHYVLAGAWRSKGDPALAIKASGRRYGIFGMGRIGVGIAERLKGFGGSIAYTSRSAKAVPYEFCDTLLALAERSDVLFLAAPSEPSTKGVVDRRILDALGAGGFLINVARGALVDEGELVSALRDGRLGGAGLDVFADEPNVPGALFGLPNVAITPHVGSATVSTREAMARLMIANLDAFFAGRPVLTPVD